MTDYPEESGCPTLLLPTLGLGVRHLPYHERSIFCRRISGRQKPLYLVMRSFLLSRTMINRPGVIYAEQGLTRNAQSMPQGLSRNVV